MYEDFKKLTLLLWSTVYTYIMYNYYTQNIYIVYIPVDDNCFSQYWTRTVASCPGTSGELFSSNSCPVVQDLALRNNDRSVPIPSLLAIWESRNGVVVIQSEECNVCPSDSSWVHIDQDCSEGARGWPVLICVYVDSSRSGHL